MTTSAAKLRRLAQQLEDARNTGVETEVMLRIIAATAVETAVHVSVLVQHHEAQANIERERGHWAWFGKMIWRTIIGVASLSGLVTIALWLKDSMMAPKP